MPFLFGDLGACWKQNLWKLGGVFSNMIIWNDLSNLEEQLPCSFFIGKLEQKQSFKSWNQIKVLSFQLSAA